MKRLNAIFGTVFAYPFVIGTAFFLPHCANRHRVLKKEIRVSRPTKETPTIVKNNNPPITIWIHGTRLLKNTPYITEFNCHTQVKYAAELKPTCPLYAIARSIHLSNPERFAWNTFYIFGWSGALNSTKRYEAGKKLYIQLVQIVESYREEYGTVPIIRLITHSHGGNLALSMAEVTDTYPFTVDELIMLACPVQYETCDAVQSPLFARIYNIYSPLDFVQIIAPQFNRQKTMVNGSHTWIPISARRFDDHPNIVQTKVKLNGRALFHEDFVRPNFLQSLSTVIDTMAHMKDDPGYPNKEHLISINIGNKRRR